jgi:ATP-dependent DNA ligase
VRRRPIFVTGKGERPKPWLAYRRGSCLHDAASRHASGAHVIVVARRFPLIVETLARLRSRSCIIDGEAVACDDNGVASFDLVRHHRANGRTFVYAFDLIELNGDDLRRDPLEVRKATLASIVAKASPGIRFNEHIEGDGPTVFAHACKMGLEGIVSKRKDSTYRSGRSPDWLKMKNPACLAVKREAEEDWGR